MYVRKKRESTFRGAKVQKICRIRKLLNNFNTLVRLSIPFAPQLILTQMRANPHKLCPQIMQIFTVLLRSIRKVVVVAIWRRKSIENAKKIAL